MKAAWSQIRRELASRRAPPAPVGGAFWDDFRARARMLAQESPSAARTRPTRTFWAAAVPVAGALAAALLAMFLLRDRDALPAVQIKALDVIAPHSAVVIMNDRADNGTVVWIAGMDVDDMDMDDTDLEEGS